MTSNAPFLLSLVLLLGLVPCAAAQGTIPALKGTSLAGTSVTLPASTPVLLIVGFSRKSTDAATLWGKRARVADPALPVYTLPMLAEVPRLLRGIVLHSMRGAVPPVVQPFFVPVLDHEDDWKKAAGYEHEDAVYVLLIDARGVIRWRMEGAVTDASLAEMVRQVKGLAG